MSYDNGIISKNLREGLIKFPLYKDDHLVLVNTQGVLYIGYASNLKPTQTSDKIGFDLNIKEDFCNILSFNLGGCEREKEYGGLLYRIIENFCLEQFNCKTFITIPSSLSKKAGFWEKQGFRYLNAIVVEKVLF
ncbi:MAG: hypothetical protein AABX77_02800 [Nanoarchaeota archaeon]